MSFFISFSSFCICGISLFSFFALVQMNRLKSLAPAIEKELLSKWSLSRSYLFEFGRNNNGFITISSQNNNTTKNANPREDKLRGRHQIKDNNNNNTNKKEGVLSLLVDPSMNPPIRMVSQGSFNVEYIRKCLSDAYKYRYYFNNIERKRKVLIDFLIEKILGTNSTQEAKQHIDSFMVQ